MHSIRIKITGITIAAILTTVLCVFAGSFYTLQKANDRSSVEMMNLIGRDTRNSVERYTESIEHSIEMISNIAADSLDRVVLAENGAIGTDTEQTVRTAEQQEQLDAYLREYCDGIRETFTGIAAHTHGITSYYFCISPDISKTEQGFLYYRAGKAGFDGHAELDVSSLDPADEDKNAWYFTPIQRGRPSWVGPYSASVLKDMWVVSYSVPLYCSGSLIGVIGMDIPVDILIDQVRDIRVYRTGYVSLLDAENRVLYHPDREFRSMLDAKDLPFSNKVFLRTDSGDELIRFDKNGQEQQLSFCTLSNGMKLVIVAPTREINAAWINFAKNSLVITVLTTILFAVIVMLAMRAITRPLRTLTAASQRLADADYDVELRYRGKDEVGTLTAAFMKMRDQIKQYIENLNRQLLTDRLTGLPNFRHFFRLAAAERDRLLKEDRKPAMLFFDMLGLKHYNRQYGFEAGDERIRRFASILSDHFGERNVCRISGDHFSAVADENNLEASLQEFFRKCGDADKDNPILVTAGIYPNRLEEADVNVACDRAKAACNKNKSPASSGFCWFDYEMLKAGETYRYIISNLDRALEEGWIKVYYQPIIRASDGKICDEEALARWIDPVMGFLSPADFIPTLETSKLIYKLDLYVVDQVLKKMKQQAAAGMHVVPQSINLSRFDFDSCDIVKEITKRVDEAGIDRSMISIEITESVIGSDFDFMKEQVERFRSLGFPVWMDDFGSGYSSLDVLQQIHFDLIKFDMRFMERFNEGSESRIIITELVKMAIGLGMDTVCEGVELAEQVDFLKEIGCTRIQGYYYSKPLPFEEIMRQFESGTYLEFENPAESQYYASIGRVDLYDMGAMADDTDSNLAQYFNTIPMSILEVNGTMVKHNRCNQSYREFVKQTFGRDYSQNGIDVSLLPASSIKTFLNAVIQCGKDGKRGMLEQNIDEYTTAHALMHRIAVNPVTGTAAVAAAILIHTREGEQQLTNYVHIAKVLSVDFVYLYYVNLETEEFTEYTSDAALDNLFLERHGEDFFAASRKDAKQRLFEEDQEHFINLFTRENIEKALDEQGTFTITYRLLINGKPEYVSLKTVRMPNDRSRVIIGVNNIDAQMREKEAHSRIRTEHEETDPASDHRSEVSS